MTIIDKTNKCVERFFDYIHKKTNVETNIPEEKVHAFFKLYIIGTQYGHSSGVQRSAEELKFDDLYRNANREERVILTLFKGNMKELCPEHEL